MPWITSALALDWYGAHRPRPTGSWDAIIVAGCPVRPDGSPGLVLRRRVERAVELWRQGLAPLLFFTGGGPEGRCEAECAKELALIMGVPADAMDLERRSETTLQNARFAFARLGPARVIVVTDACHVLRARWIFGALFEEVACVASDLPLHRRLRLSLREVIAVLHYTFVGRFR